jgi:hypothetical protein
VFLEKHSQGTLGVNGVVQYLKVEHLIFFEMIRALAGFVS